MSSFHNYWIGKHLNRELPGDPNSAVEEPVIRGLRILQQQTLSTLTVSDVAVLPGNEVRRTRRRNRRKGKKSKPDKQCIECDEADGSITSVGLGSIPGGAGSITLGEDAGDPGGSTGRVSIGYKAGRSSAGGSGTEAVAVGYDAGEDQKDHAVAVGAFAGKGTQENYAIAVGSRAGHGDQGEYSIALGAFAGYSDQKKNSIIINASKHKQDADKTHMIVINASDAPIPIPDHEERALFVAPIRERDTPGRALHYDTQTKEVYYLVV